MSLSSNTLRFGRRAASFLPLALLALALIAGACDGGGEDDAPAEKLLSPQNNQLDVYDLATSEATTLIPSDRSTVNGQACMLPDGSGNFLMGEDTRQSEEEGAERQGWGVFSPEGELVKKIPEPESEGEAEQPEPFGCGFDAQDRLFVTDVGSGNFDAEDGKLIVFFPPDYEEYCLLDTSLRTAGAVAIDEAGNVYVPETVPPGTVHRFAPPFPASPDECETVQPEKSPFIEGAELQTPIGIARAPNGNWYVSSVVAPAAVHEFDANGNFVRVIVEAEAGGNPSGLAVASDGTIYYADLGLVEQPPPQFFGPEDGKGTVRKVAFDEQGNPLPPEIIGRDLSYPDAVSIFSLE